MKRFKNSVEDFDLMEADPDGEWIRYSDHVEAMKRIAGAPVAQGLTDEQIQSMWNDACQDGPGRPGWSRHIRFARAILTQAAPSASAQQAEPVYQCMCTDDDDADHNQGGKYLWMDVSKEAFEKLSAREDVRSRIVYAAPAPSASPDDEWEIRVDGQRVRKDRWQDGFRSIVSIVRGPRGSFEIPEIIEQVRALVKASESASPANHGEDARDAARYRWLLQQSWIQTAFDRFDFADGGMQKEFERCADRMIDAAMSASKDGAA